MCIPRHLTLEILAMSACKWSVAGGRLVENVEEVPAGRDLVVVLIR